MHSLTDQDFAELIERIKSNDANYVDPDIRTLVSHACALRASASKLARDMDFVSYPIPIDENAKLVNDFERIVSQTAVTIPD